MQYKLKKKDIKLEVDVDPAIPDELVGDKLRLSQILSNLMGNAIKFTDKGVVKLSIKKTKEEEGQVSLRFEVEDTGCGINEIKIIFYLLSLHIQKKNNISKSNKIIE